jgi:hypothetical protein
MGNTGEMSQIHAKTDKLSLVAVSQADGKTRISSASRDDPLVILGEVLEERGDPNGRCTPYEVRW